jgi:hypothetical protein
VGHTLSALISEISVLREFASKYKTADVIDLGEQSMGLLPLSFAFLDEIELATDERKSSKSPDYSEMVRLTPRLLESILLLSKISAIAYIQTEYFGGIGEQGAIAWHMEKIVYPPSIVWGIGPINMALKKLGVNQKDGMDEFDTLGLGKYRSMDDWDTSEWETYL